MATKTIATAKQGFSPSVENYAFSSGTVATLDGLAIRRKRWEASEYKKSGEILHAILAESLDVFNARFLKGSSNDQKTLRIELIDRLKKDGIKVQSNSTTLTMFVRFVFGSDRKRAHGYAYVLKAAISHNIKASDLPRWIVDQGGIEEVKRRMVQSEESKAKQARLAIAKTQVIGEVQQASVTPLAQIRFDGLTGNHALLLAKPLPNGMASIIGTLSDIDEALYNALLIKMAKRKSDSNLQDATLSKEVDDLLASAASNDSVLKKAA